MHFTELTRLLADFEQHAYSITKRDHGKKELHFIPFELNAMPIEIPMEAGEFAYSLRSALDQLAWHLAYRHVRPNRPRSQRSFPLFSTANLGRFADATRDILPDAVKVIEALQPYNQGQKVSSYPLYQLNELCNLDKHMTIPVRATDGQLDVIGVQARRRREISYGFELEFDITDKFKIALSPIRTEVIFGEPLGTPSSKGLPFELRLSDLAAMFTFVKDDVIPQFVAFFV